MRIDARTVLAAAAILFTCGCATSPSVENEKMVKIYRTGSTLPVLVPYMGAEHIRYTEASKDRQGVRDTIDPPRTGNEVRSQ